MIQQLLLTLQNPLLLVLQNPFIFIFVVLWSIFWKGWALWAAAKRSEKIWFVVLLVVNTIGILEIIYLLKRKEIQKVLKKR